MARGRSASYDGQREAILAQAARLFASQGYRAASMNGVAEACGVSKSALYHYFRDKYELLVHIAEDHVARLEELADEARAEGAPADPAAAEARARRLIHRFVEEYASAQDAHRVLTEDVKFLQPEDRDRILARERKVVGGFADTLALLHPHLRAGGLDKPVAMLLFGMINWMFTWLRPGGRLTHEDMAPIVADLFFGGVGAVRLPRADGAPEPAPDAGARAGQGA